MSIHPKFIQVLSALVLLLGSTTLESKEIQVPSPGITVIQDAIFLADAGDVIILSEGIYTGTDNRDLIFFNKAVTVRSQDPNDPNVVQATIIDCNGSEGDEHRGFIFNQGETSDYVLDGLTISNGYHSSGGAIQCINSSPTIKNCRLIQNTTTGFGGGIYLENSSSIISNCHIVSNVALSLDGSGLASFNSDIEISNSIINNNHGMSVLGRGGGLYIETSQLTISDSQINGNSSGFGGGFYLFDDSDVLIDHCEVSGNLVTSHGGGVYCQDSDVDVINSTFHLNEASGFGGSIRCFTNGFANVLNSIFWENNANDGNNFALVEGANLTANYSNFLSTSNDISLEVGSLFTNGLGNTQYDPFFQSNGMRNLGTLPDVSDDVWIDGDYQLQFISPCIDAGDPLSLFSQEPSPNGDRINMGVFGNREGAQVSLSKTIVLDKSKVKQGKSRNAQDPTDALSLSGQLYDSIGQADINDIVNASQVVVRLVTLDDSDLEVSEILVDAFDVIVDQDKVLKRQKYDYKRPKDQVGDVEKFAIDYKKNRFSVDFKNVDLTGLQLPIQLEIRFGQYLGRTIFRSSQNIGLKQPLPLCLLSGAFDAIEVSKAKAKSGKNGDSLSLQGNLSAAMTEIDFTTEQVTVRWEGIGIFTETLDIGSFTSKKSGVFSYKKAKTSNGDIDSISIDLNKCSLKLSIKDAILLDKTGSVIFEITTSSENFSASTTVELD